MKIIMNNVNSGREAFSAYEAVQSAIKDDIKEGRNNFRSYNIICQDGIRVYSVCRNKDSFTVYGQEYVTA